MPSPSVRPSVLWYAAGRVGDSSMLEFRIGQYVCVQVVLAVKVANICGS